MTSFKSQAQDVHAFWNSRAGLGQAAGTGDLILKQLEMEAISKYVRDGMRVLDAGCGNGITAIHIASLYDVHVEGFDFADEMIKAAKAMAADAELKGSVGFQIGDIRYVSDTLGTFDLIYTERVLINLPDWSSQKRAILDLTNLLREDGIYVMCESSLDGLARINRLREQLDLTRIEPPWHNRYLRDRELERCAIPGVRLESIGDFSSTYYFLSRVVNAWLAAREGKEPAYDAPVNQLALQLPSIGELGQSRVWLWRKVGSSNR